MSEILKSLSGHGVSIWLDDISRERLRTGNLESLIRDKGVVGVTSNPTIFASALSKGDAYDTQLHDLAVRGVDVEEAVRAITTYDIRWAADVLRPVYDVTGGVDGRVSIEVDPRLARSTDKTIAEARALWWMVDRPNLFIKIPATLEGLPAITQAIAEGISVNVTLIFSLERYRAVMDAWLTGLEQAKAAGLNLAGIESVASFFVSRVDTEIDKRLEAAGTPEAKALKGKAAVANARLAFAAFEEVMNSPRWQALQAAGARPQRPLWASTGTKDPSYPDTLYVDELVTAGTVNTLPEKTLDAAADHGRITGDTIRPFYEQAWNTMAALKEAGIDYDDVVRVLEEEGVEKFEASWNELLATVTAELRKA
ncbi:transaldolase [Planomonospora sp. ID91781]|uniref:Transaldolase n=1 Tax=Planomonospora sphaerica TaxID=161355 RepID=A0A171DHR0_9ACTN|nr:MULTISPECIES: transaldolase [Planomonospora]MBG0823883.1 transaldolase [Planomonospora sp. ID91781]GAT68550.1 transaldolase [Planomonospora sphaerica]GGL16164.1 transaldolase 2 [Planomonospora parontospora subsp. antibiotica]GII15401.1 transaldolase 2 [Planomonospora parontospora subsp. antibiotica]